MCEFTPKISCSTTTAPRTGPSGCATQAGTLKPSADVMSTKLPMMLRLLCRVNGKRLGEMKKTRGPGGRPGLRDAVMRDLSPKGHSCRRWQLNKVVLVTGGS